MSYSVEMVRHFLSIERYSRVCLVLVCWKAASHSWDKKLVFVQIVHYSADRNKIVLEKRQVSPGLVPVLPAVMLVKAVKMILLTVLLALTLLPRGLHKEGASQAGCYWDRGDVEAQVAALMIRFVVRSSPYATHC